MYNQTLKKRFVANYNDRTAKTYLADLTRMSVAEERNNKDMFNFSIEQIDEALKGIQFKKKSSIERTVSTCRMYSEWANQNGFVPAKINLWEIFTTEKLDQYIWHYALKNSFITREELFAEIISEIVNPVDYIPILLVFEGIYGQKMEEVLNLKYSDIDFNTGRLRLTRDDGSLRDITIEDERVLNLLEDAESDLVYYKNNGISDSIIAEATIIKTPYVIRRTTRKGITGSNVATVIESDEQVNYASLSARFYKVFRGYRNTDPEKNREPFVDGYSFLNATNVFKSGYFDYCKRMEAKIGRELVTEDYEKACIRYGLSPSLAISYKLQYLNYKEINEETGA
jgi:site-specific recombinase XerD